MLILCWFNYLMTYNITIYNRWIKSIINNFVLIPLLNVPLWLFAKNNGIRKAAFNKSRTAQRARLRIFLRSSWQHCILSKPLLSGRHYHATGLKICQLLVLVINRWIFLIISALVSVDPSSTVYSKCLTRKRYVKYCNITSLCLAKSSLVHRHGALCNMHYPCNSSRYQDLGSYVRQTLLF